ncbi:hypothetical protein [[Phormidium] sp. ETS-05]|uniref:hypothetical protein n=1 Tax=[Phormidium] sp. ETS-05 TaxID=222819 RepID=UPI0018EEE90B|nr:hypothetical protein [[Phormidium] sp. ETS-05]
MTYQKLREKLDPNSPAIFYISTQPQHYPLAAAILKRHRLWQPDDTLIIEKPLAMSETGAEALLKTFSEELKNAGLVEHFNLKLVLGDTPFTFGTIPPLVLGLMPKRSKKSASMR